MIKKIHQENNELHNNGYLVYPDLMPELERLEKIFSKLSEVKIDCEIQINCFNSNYMLHLGSLIEEILELRVVIFGKKNKRTQFGFDAKTNQMFEEAQIDYDAFQKNYQQQLQDLPQTLNDSEKRQLKIAYRKASRLCHPDKLVEDAKAKGEEFFKALNEAYRHQDLNRVKGILLKLEAETTSLLAASERIDNRAILQQKIALLREHIVKLEIEVKRLLESEMYQRIQAIIDMDSYFAQLEQELKAEL